MDQQTRVDLANVGPGLAWAYEFDENGKGRPLSVDEPVELMHGRRFIWVHVNLATPRTRNWLAAQECLPREACVGWIERVWASGGGNPLPSNKWGSASTEVSHSFIGTWWKPVTKWGPSRMDLHFAPRTELQWSGWSVLPGGDAPTQVGDAAAAYQGKLYVFGVGKVHSTSTGCRASTAALGATGACCPATPRPAWPKPSRFSRTSSTCSRWLLPTIASR